MNYLWYNELRHSDLHNIIKVLTDSSILPKKCFLLKKNSTENVRLCLVTVFVFYFQKLVFGNIKKKQFSCIFEIKNMFG